MPWIFRNDFWASMNQATTFESFHESRALEDALTRQTGSP
jgi:G:T/U-mismatch repair DNA glycosylase